MPAAGDVQVKVQVFGLELEAELWVTALLPLQSSVPAPAVKVPRSPPEEFWGLTSKPFEPDPETVTVIV